MIYTGKYDDVTTTTADDVDWITVPSPQFYAERLYPYQMWQSTVASTLQFISGNSTNPRRCSYCGNKSGKRDSRGGCISCGAPE